MNLSLNGCWTARIDGNEYTVSVPAAIQSCEALGERYPDGAMPNGYLGSITMTKEFRVDEPKDGAHIVFRGVMPYATVFLNDSPIGKVTCCQIAFRFDCSRVLRSGTNVLRVEIEEKNLELIGGMRFDVLKWSGIFDGVELQMGTAQIGDPQIAFDGELVKLTVPVSAEAERGTLDIWDGAEEVRTVYAEVTGKTLTFQTPAEGLTLWTVDTPKLYTMTLTLELPKGKETFSFRTGIRRLKCDRKRIYLNDRPLYLFGGGDEYFSPTISPLIDREIIRNRFLAMKELGFNFYRYHTHTPTQTELDVCDELGILVSVEIPILSNFSRITDAKMGLEILAAYIQQTRMHPCIFSYCLGNEAIQLMVRNPWEHELARRGYACIREHTSYQLGIFCFGNQGERPALPGDFLTPHLWSQDFRWAYEGLTSVPWDYLPRTMDDRPCVIHEFGKYGVWPDDEEDALYPPHGYALRFKETNDALFEGQASARLRGAIIRNGRNLALLCASTILQAVRRQRQISGFVYWTFFRMGVRCGGLCGDMGQIPPEARAYLLPATSPIGIFADRDFDGRTFYSGEQTRISVTVSNFGNVPIHDGSIICLLQSDGYPLWEEKKTHISCMAGEIEEKMQISLELPSVCKETPVRFRMQLQENGAILAENEMEFWCYPYAKANPRIQIVSFLHDTAQENCLRRTINTVTPIWDWISVLLGCEIPEYGFEPSDGKIPTYLEWALKKCPPEIIIADQLDGIVHTFLKWGVPVLMVDNGRFPPEVYAASKPDNAFFSCNRFYAPFRSSWEEGNGATVLEGELFGNDLGFADLRYFSCIEGALPLLREQTLEHLGMQESGNALRLFRRVKHSRKSEEEPIYFAQMNRKELENCIYYMDGICEGTSLAITTLNLFADACGQDLLYRILVKLMKEKKIGRREEE